MYRDYHDTTAELDAPCAKPGVEHMILFPRRKWWPVFDSSRETTHDEAC
jgi:hypothetical protein